MRPKREPSRSKSPREGDRVRFVEGDKEIPVPAGGLRMKDAKAAVERKPGESRAKWKSRVFQHKRKLEEQPVKK